MFNAAFAVLRRCRLLLFLPIVLAVGGSASVVLGQEPAVNNSGIGRGHGTLSLAPWEQIDLFTGNVLLTFTDIDLPGNGGFNLTIRRVMDVKAYGGSWYTSVRS
jgi:hypothetical protein